MTEIASRDLRNSTAEVLRRVEAGEVEAGEQVTITPRGRPVAELTPVRTVRRRPGFLVVVASYVGLEFVRKEPDCWEQPMELGFVLRH